MFLSKSFSSSIRIFREARMSHDVFVSYSTKDKVVADAIVAAMEKTNIRCWYAPRDIKPGEDWGNAISLAIEQSSIFLIIFSGNANYSQRVLDELNFAIIEEKTILPFRIEKLEPVGAMKLHLSSRHWLDAYEPSWKTHIDKLVKNVSAIVEPVVEPVIEEQDIKVPEHSAPINKQPKNNKIFKILAGVVIGIALITAGWFGYHALFPPQEIALATEVPTATSKATIEQIKYEPTNTKVAPTRTPQPTSTSTPAPAWITDFADPILADIASRPPDIEDNFTSESSAWVLGSWCADWRKSVENSEMVITGCPVQNVQMTFHDYVLEIDVRSVNSPLLADIHLSNGSAIGYMVRVDNSLANIHDVSSSIPALSKESSFSSPVHIRIIVKKSQMAFYVNDEPIGYFEDKKFSLYRGIYPTIELKSDSNFMNNGGEAVMAYSNFKVWNIADFEIP
jgi:hypothetical protein